MSTQQAQTVRITTTTTSTSSSLVLNTGYLKTLPGILKLLEVVLGIICVILIGTHYNQGYDHNSEGAEIFYYLMVVTFAICSFILLLSCLVSWSTGGIISKTIFELIYHLFGGVLLIIASVIILVVIHDSHGNILRRYSEKTYNQLLAAGVIGAINGILYLASTVLAQRSYKGI